MLMCCQERIRDVFFRDSEATLINPKSNKRLSRARQGDMFAGSELGHWDALLSYDTLISLSAILENESGLAMVHSPGLSLPPLPYCYGICVCSGFHGVLVLSEG